VSLLTAATLQVASRAPVGMDSQEMESPAQVNWTAYADFPLLSLFTYSVTDSYAHKSCPLDRSLNYAYGTICNIFGVGHAAHAGAKTLKFREDFSTMHQVVSYFV